MVAAVGVDVGGTKVEAALVDAGTVLVQERVATPKDAAGLVAAIARLVGEVGARAPEAPVGIAIAGYVAPDRATVMAAPNLALRDEPLGSRVAEATGRRVVVENDANAAAWAEYRAVAAHGTDLVCVTVGTGIGGGVVLGGRLQRGRGYAAELGHIPLVPDGLLCGCGAHGCWEQYGSGRALVAFARAGAARDPRRAARLLALAGGDAARIDGEAVTCAAREGDGVALDAFAELARWNARGITAVTAVLDAPLVVVGGGVAETGELLLDPLRAAVAALRPPTMGPPPEVRTAALGNLAGAIGAADLAHDAGA